MSNKEKNEMEERIIQARGLNFHVILAGPTDGKPVFLLHGFPEFWYGWRHQIEALAGAGYRVIVPDQRGYNLSDKPKGISAYRLDLLAEDVIGIIDELGYERISLVGHDWGGIVAWAAAVLFPQRIERLAVLDAPYPAITFRSALTHPRQFLRSSYILFFQLPWLPEALFRRNQWAPLVNSLRGSALSGAFKEPVIEKYRDAWSQERAMTSMLNWYRALMRLPVKLPAHPRVEQPVLILWGGQDFALGRELAYASASECQNAQVIIFENASHWIPVERAGEVNENLMRFLRSPVENQM